MWSFFTSGFCFSSPAAHYSVMLGLLEEGVGGVKHDVSGHGRKRICVLVEGGM